MTTEVDKTSTAPPMYKGEDWETLTAGAAEVFGADLEHGAQLLGVPQCLIMATFRRGDYTDKFGVKGFYVSLDTIIGPIAEIEKGIKRGRIPADLADYAKDCAGEHLVVNEGGTGIYRQIVAYLEATGRVDLKSDLPAEGAYGESRHDISPAEWTVDDTAEFRVGDDGQLAMAFSIRLLCPRGFRSSEYANEYTKTGVTRYIA